MGPSGTWIPELDRDEARRWLNSMPFASKYLFSPTDTMAEQLKGQWNTLPMGKKKGGLCQRNPQMAKQIIEKFGSFLSFLIRLYPSVTGLACNVYHIRIYLKMAQNCRDRDRVT